MEERKETTIRSDTPGQHDPPKTRQMQRAAEETDDFNRKVRVNTLRAMGLDYEAKVEESGGLLARQSAVTDAYGESLINTMTKAATGTNVNSFKLSARFKMAVVEKSLYVSGAKSVYRWAIQSDRESMEGLEKTGMVAYTAGALGIQAGVRTLSVGEYNRIFKQYGTTDTRAIIQSFNKRLRELGQPPIPDVKGSKLYLHALRMLGHGKARNIPPEAMLILNQAKMLGLHSSFTADVRPTGGLMKRPLRMGLHKVFQHGGDAGRGLHTTINLTTASARAITSAVKAVWALTNIGRYLLDKAMILGMTRSITALKEAQASGKLGAGGTRTLNRLQTAKERKIQRTVRRQQKARARRKPLERLKIKVRNGVYGTTRKAINYLASKSKVIRTMQELFEKTSFIWEWIMRVKAFISGCIKLALGAVTFLLVAGVLYNLITAMLASATAVFNANTADTTVMQAAIATMECCYKEDMQYLFDLNKKGYQVNLSYNSEQNVEEYQTKKIEANLDETYDFKQSTNCAEILSVALERFDYDLESAGKTAVCDFVEKLYYGSHVLDVELDTGYSYDSMPLEAGDTDEENGTVTVETKYANATYTAVFFDSESGGLLACELKNKPVRNTTRSFVNYAVDSQDGAYAYFRECGYTHAGTCGIMANILHESGFNPTAENSSGHYGLCQWDRKNRKPNLIKFCEKNGYDYTTISGQIRFIVHELEGMPGLNKILKNTTDPNVAAKEFDDKFERSGGAGTAKRQAKARSYAAKYAAYANDWSSLSGGEAARIASSERLKWLFPDGLPKSASAMEKYLTTIEFSAIDADGNEFTKKLRVHKKLANDILQIFAELKAIGFPVQKNATGAYCWRNMVSNTSAQSHHSYGVVVDLNYSANPYGVKKRKFDSPYCISDECVAIFKKHGFYWGGNWKGSLTDIMHFTYTGH